MSIDALSGWFAVMFSLTLSGVLLIRIVAMRAERRMHELRLERARRSSTYSASDFPDASLRPFITWILAAFIAGAALTFLAQRLVSSAEPTTTPVASSAVAANASSTTISLPAIEDLPASEELGRSSLGDPWPSLLTTQSSRLRDDPASSIATSERA